MIRLLVALLLVLSSWMLAAPDAVAIPAGCLPGGLPTTPGPDAVGKDVTWGVEEDPDSYHIDVWRVPCQGGNGKVALLLRATPLTGSPFVCSDNFNLIQGSAQIRARINPAANETGSFCTDLLTAMTFSLEQASTSDPAIFTPTDAFTLDINQLADHTSLGVPAGSGVAPLAITVVSTGCSPCTAGQTASFHVHVVNPGEPIAVELKTGIHIPGEATPISVLGIHFEDTLETGEFDIPLIDIVVAEEAPNGTYTVEAAILEPILGATLSRHSVGVLKE